MARRLPAQPKRVETGAVKFGDDWCGVFIRGDNAMAYALALRTVLSRDITAPNSEDPISDLCVQELLTLLQ